MKFTWDAYKGLLKLLREEKYHIMKYTDYMSGKLSKEDRITILRHDIDTSIAKAFEMGVTEVDLGVNSTYFVLLTSDLYNPAAPENIKMLRELYHYGHDIGLHFDEAKYMGKSEKELKCMAERERYLLEEILDIPIKTISMHRPSKATLEADWNFDNMINSYSYELFHEFKYVSDSRMHWREDVESIIKGHEYNRIHILTHAFWYEKISMEMKDKLLAWFKSASRERYEIFNQNFRDLSEVVKREEI